MKKSLSKTAALVAALAMLTGCATQISPETIAHADYGSPPPKNYKEIIKQDLSRTLIDPGSALYEFNAPSKGYTKEAPMFGTRQNFGWKVCGMLNSKNRFGGYVGAVPFFTLFRNGVIVERMIGEVPGRYGSIINANVETVCSR